MKYFSFFGNIKFEKKNPALAVKNFIIKINLVKNWKEKLIYELKSYAIFVRVVILKE